MRALLASLASGPTVDACPDCPKTPIRRLGGDWCPGCRGWVVKYTLGGEPRVSVMRPYSRARMTLAGTP